MMKVEIPRKKSNFSDIIFRTLPLVFVHITIDRATRETRKVGNWTDNFEKTEFQKKRELSNWTLNG